MSRKIIITEELLAPAVADTHICYQVCALYEDNRMVEATLQAADTESILHNIYVARVKNVAANLSAAFVEVAKGLLCYLPFENIKNPLFTKKNSKKRIAAGDELVVQIVKEAVKTKDAVATTDLSFPGECLVLTTADTSIGVSSKLRGEQRKQLRLLAQELKGDGPYGIIIRTNAAEKTEAQIRAEFLRLKAEYENLYLAAPSRTCYTCLRKERPFYEKMLLDTDKAKLEEAVTDCPQVLEQLRQNLPPGCCSLRLYQDSLLPLAKLYNIKGQVMDALKQRVWLKSGANILIQPTEALTVIDVNSGKNTARKDKPYNHYLINLEAAAEIARQLRLRNISGIIIVDFIDMDEDAWNATLLEQFRSHLKQDPVPARLAGMTKLGLVELTRKKIKKSLAEQLACV